MLNNDALAELSKLKQIIEDNKDSGEGLVAGSTGRHGFVKLDDGRSIYLSADEMQRVLPGDRIRVEVITNDKDKQEAKIEKLLEKNFKRFTASYSIKGNNHFVNPDLRDFKRGLFVPPKERKKFADGDLVYCQVVKHPFNDGRAQAKVVGFIGKPNSAGIEHKLIQYKHQLREDFHEKVIAQAKSVLEQAATADFSQRDDLTQLNFVTIDGESTQDLDDALYAEKTDNGWILYTAIADPSAYVEADSPLDKAALARSTSVYFPGKALPMFPTVLTVDLFSLAAEKQRPAIACKMAINTEGKIEEFGFIQARVQSKAKLSYELVSKQIAGEQVIEDDSIATSIANLSELANARRLYRQKNHVLQDDNQDFYYELNDNLLIETIHTKEPTAAHRLVEEAMLATNICAGATLAEAANGKALFSCHGGFRPERTHEFTQLLKQTEHPLAESDLLSFTTYCEFQQSLFDAGNITEDNVQSLKNVSRRLLQPGEISVQAKPHYGLGLECYALVTSPIRRYQDLHNHRLLKQLTATKTEAEEVSTTLQTNIGTVRMAQRELTQRLLCHYLSDQEGNEFQAKIVAVSSQGLAMRIIDSGAESFIPLRNGPKLNVKYDSIRLTLTVNDVLYQLEQVITVILEKVRLNQYQLQLKLPSNS